MHKYVIKLNNLEFNATHGLHEQEKINPQKFELDIEISYSKQEACNDDINQSINYESVYTIVQNIIASNTFNLIETLGEKIIQNIFQVFKNAHSVNISIRKPEVKFDQNSNCVEVSVSRFNE